MPVPKVIWFHSSSVPPYVTVASAVQLLKALSSMLKTLLGITIDVNAVSPQKILLLIAAKPGSIVTLVKLVHDWNTPASKTGLPWGIVNSVIPVLKNAIEPTETKFLPKITPVMLMTFWKATISMVSTLLKSTVPVRPDPTKACCPILLTFEKSTSFSALHL